LFRALLIIIDSKDHHLEDSKPVGDIRVSLVRIGIEDRLSVPITLNTIQQYAEVTASPNVITTTLQVTIDFNITLEDRERATSTSTPVLPSPSYLGSWEHDFGDQEPVRYPSSTLVSDKNAAEWGWCGDSKYYDSRVMDMVEMRIRGTITD